MDEEQKNRIYELKVSSRDIVEMVKYVKEIQKNVNFYLKDSNLVIKGEYNFLREEIARTIDRINKIRNFEDELDILASIEILNKNINSLDLIQTGRLDSLIRDNTINQKMATSLINDSSFAYSISYKLIHVASALWIKSGDIKDLRG